jgi:hypothetical protein
MNTRERLENGDFENKEPYPTEEHMKKVHADLYEEQDKIRVEKDRLESLAEQNREAILTAERLQEQAYRDEQFRITAAFRKSLEEEHGTVGHPKADLLWEKAWEDGHSGGYGEVLNYYIDLVELVK